MSYTGSGTGRALGSGSGLGGGRGGSGGGLLASRGALNASDSAVSPSFEPAAVTQELGDLFEYKLKEPITIQKNRSALVPIAQSPVAAEQVSIWNDRSGAVHPQRSLWLTNSTGVTLDGGSFSVMEDGAFAGEGIFDPIHAGEKRLISYATDLALNAKSASATEQQRVSRVLVSRGVMTQQSELREKKTYTFRNEDSAPRTVIVEHPVRTGYSLRGSPDPAETTANWYRFRVQVAPSSTATLVVEEARPTAVTYAITNIDARQIELLVRQQSIGKSLEDAFRKILSQKAAIADLDARKDARDEEMKRIYDDQQRVRENMKALKGSAEEKALVLKYTQQLNEQETRLAALQKEIEQLSAQGVQAQAELDRMIQEMSFDVTL